MAEEKRSFKKLIKDILYISAKRSARALYYIGSYIIPANEKIILFESSNGRNYTGNPKYIYEEIVSQGLDKEYKCVWSFMHPDKKIPGNAIQAKRSFFKFLYYTLRSGTWIFDSRHLYYLKKNKKTKYIQTWHGTPLKKLALDMDYIDMSGNQDIEAYHEEFRKNTSAWQYLISQNEYSSNIFRRAFDFKGEMLEIGYPRNDILVNKDNEKDIDEIKTRLNIPKDKKIILYAPTWRDNQFYTKGQYKFATEMDFDRLYEEFSDDYALIIKFHYLVKENMDWSKYNDFIIECDADWDIQELYLISDMMITDYSSVMFDYSILKRPMIFFAYDLDDYKNNLRDFYFDMVEDVPGPICQTNEELVDFIKNYSENAYKNTFGEKYEKWNDKFNQFDDGKASQKIINLIKER
ncbi:CDP-glycerol:poly(glycerophosphate) glycerophosphotransferase [Methanobrevibacter ruminantium M1]|uniref:CDP-glycerol:poly(Glycerophosphate) glycerophosphotransferase n=1 Tax=Methanobrevibacter ruminantium (strain ATCC 35063 / DSM 1093 / JCM 13430 / OCM 146 / M1) TaxID=634498 RepID=D3E1F6_METRM|nr:CDP-glycerol glycerophosphotransferase family protein [Methanobrevibacter ruminantium]ADC48041.1 CDP-glycerol:poly(glycerophosphate) glycerophosphotransferase [Methanobrevibacter ruminantium M1]